MSRYVVVTPVTIAFSSYTSPGRQLFKGQVVELSTSEVSAIGSGNLRAAGTDPDTLGESFAVSNSD